jgi:hypothetical protein
MTFFVCNPNEEGYDEVTTAERILTENEKYGSGFLDRSALGGAWVVQHASSVGDVTLCAIFTNPEAAENYIRDRDSSDEYLLSVWKINDTYPFPKDE